MALPLKDKIAVVTGGSRGIGRAVVERFARDGAKVVTCGRSPRPADLPLDIDWVTADIGIEAQVVELREIVIKRHGKAQILVNNAGIQIERRAASTSNAEFNELISTNIRGVFYCCRAFFSDLADGGAIVNVGSVSGLVADPGLSVYGASKAFVHAFTRSLATEYGEVGIRCNTVCPGWIDTGMSDSAFAVASDPMAARRDAERRHPLGRMGTVSDVANAVAWLASDEAAFCTGQLFVVDGGLTAVSPLRPSFF
ncbi:SDR family NAD(P)-dependent oxidoreductase [Hyphomicrobium facile]|uniref:NAD(P)-dependent dehydrogenase, short-chain alcohol dehydrogenase family n=1 Tax=Hyphomicrobium facile TaxID=51670 RepID=A0A1I7NDU7_9HYPH|nr:SDR family oxidoreductase [Hyphomicrobium facile]SFV32830.1 NAD(P)-dependent dehydrogenase, short-chain alcohol dehydrogenase family [Hyphomicrobium facile]